MSGKQPTDSGWKLVFDAPKPEQANLRGTIIAAIASRGGYFVSGDDREYQCGAMADAILTALTTHLVAVQGATLEAAAKLCATYSVEHLEYVPLELADAIRALGSSDLLSAHDVVAGGPIVTDERLRREARASVRLDGETQVVANEKSTDLWVFVDDCRRVVEDNGRCDWVDLRNLLRVVDALKREVDEAVNHEHDEQVKLWTSCESETYRQALLKRAIEAEQREAAMRKELGEMVAAMPHDTISGAIICEDHPAFKDCHSQNCRRCKLQSWLDAHAPKEE